MFSSVKFLIVLKFLLPYKLESTYPKLINLLVIESAIPKTEDAFTISHLAYLSPKKETSAALKLASLPGICCAPKRGFSVTSTFLNDGINFVRCFTAKEPLFFSLIYTPTFIYFIYIFFI